MGPAEGETRQGQQYSRTAWLRISHTEASMGPQSKSTYQVPRKERDPHVVTNQGRAPSARRILLPPPPSHALPGSSCQCPALVWPRFRSWYREESPGFGVRRCRFEPHICDCLTELPFLLLKWGRTRMTEPLHRKDLWGGITRADLAAAPTGASWVPTPQVSISHQRKGMLTHPHRGS